VIARATHRGTIVVRSRACTVYRNPSGDAMSSSGFRASRPRLGRALDGYGSTAIIRMRRRVLLCVCCKYACISSWDGLLMAFQRRVMLFSLASSRKNSSDASSVPPTNGSMAIIPAKYSVDRFDQIAGSSPFRRFSRASLSKSVSSEEDDSVARNCPGHGNRSWNIRT